MKRILASVTALAVIMGPLAEQAPVFAGKFIAPMAQTGKGLNLPVSPVMTPGATAGLGTFQNLSVFSLDSSLPGLTTVNTSSRKTPSSVQAQARTRSAEVSISRTIKEAAVSAQTLNTDQAAPTPRSVGLIRKAISSIKKSAGTLHLGKIAKMNDNGARRHGSRLFDALGAAREAALSNNIDREADAPKAAAPKSRRWTHPLTRLGKLLTTDLFSRRNRAPPRPRTPFDKDEYGGPQKKDLRAPEKSGRLAGMRRRFGTLKNNVFYGFKWAINMMGIATIVTLVVKPLAALFPWQLFVSDSFLSSTGRVELLTDIGHHGIIDAVSSSPWSFLFMDMPLMVGWEELSFRLASFGLIFLFLASFKPIAARVKNFLKDLPNLFGIPSTGIWFAGKFAAVSKYAFPAAVLFSSLSFALAHIAAWGFSPVSFAIHATLGAVLAYVAYRSRGLAAAFFAHFFFNLAMITIGVLLPLTLLPATSVVAMSLASVFSVAFLWYNFRLHRKAKARAIAEARGHAPADPKSWWRKILTVALIVPILAAAYGLFSNISSERANTLKPSAAIETRLAQDQFTVPTSPFMLQELQEFLKIHTPKAVGAQGKASQAVLSTVEITRNAKPAIVMVRTPSGMGTGFIIDKSGLLVTNAHVVAESVTKTASGQKISREHNDKVIIRFSNGREVPGAVVGYNPDKDIALVALPPNPFGWPTVKIGDSRTLKEGEKIIAMGHPRGLPFSVTQGIVSGLDFRDNGFVRFSQHDASVNPGNSGGPLFNDRGEVIGINSTIFSVAGGFNGISFAISSADLLKTLDQFKKLNNIDTAWMGAIFYPNSPDAPRFGLYLDAVRPGSPADQAGLRAGDVLIDIDGRKLSSTPTQAVGQLSLTLRAKIPSDEIKVSVSRDGEVKTLTIVLGARD